MRTEPKTCRCGQPAPYKGYVSRTKIKIDGSYSRAKQEVRWMCKAHHLEYMHGLWPFCCVKSCERMRAAASQCELLDYDFLIWIPLDPLVSERGKAMRPSCPWCLRKLRLYPRPRHTHAQASKALRRATTP